MMMIIVIIIFFTFNFNLIIESNDSLYFYFCLGPTQPLNLLLCASATNFFQI